jgi:hypothetical protein
MSLVFNFYRKFISPLFHAASATLSGNPHTGCRFIPTCSCYAEQAIKKYGWIKGSALALKRISRCHPFSGTDQSGGMEL